MKDCLAQDKYRYTLERAVDESFVAFLERFGPVTVFREFAHPLIKMDVPKKLRLVSVMGTNEVEVFFKKDAPKGLQKRFERALDGFLE